MKIGDRKTSQINVVKDSVDGMFIQLQKMLDLSKVLLEENSNEIALSIIEEDSYLDQLQKDIMVEVNLVIIKEQPKARDARIVLGAYAAASDIERIGDYLKNFAKMMLKSSIEERKHQKLVEELLNEIENRIMETRAAFKDENHQLAKMIAKRDEEIDLLSNKLVADINKLLEESLDKTEVKAYTRI